MNTALTITVLVLLWGFVLVRLPTLARDARRRALWATCFSLAVCKVAALPSVNARLTRLTDSAQIIPHLLGIAAVFFLLRFISLITDVYANRSRAATYQAVLTVIVTALLVALSVVSPVGIRTSSPELLTGSVPLAVVAYWVVLEAYLGGVLVAAIALFWRLSRRAPRGLLRVGLRLIAAGLALVALYAVQRVVFVLAHAAGAGIPEARIAPVFDALRAVGVIAALAGALVPATSWVRSLVEAHRSLRALRPLWQEMRGAFPEVILFSPGRALFDQFVVGDVHLRLYRRVIEIRDGMLALRDYLPAQAGAEATAFLAEREPVSTVDSAALAEACCVELALRRLRSGERSPGDGRWAAVGADLADEVRWMREVGRCLRRPEPAEFAAWWLSDRAGARPGSPAPTAS